MTKEFLEKQYVREKCSCGKIAEMVGITRQGVWKALKRFGIPTRAKEDSTFIMDGQQCKLSQGYIWVYCPDHSRSNGNYVKRSVLVLEDKLKRKLLAGEFPHHKDEDRLNDSPENLEPTTRPSHATLHFAKKCRGDLEFTLTS